MAIISALKNYVDYGEEITIYSDSKNIVNQLNHEFAINNEYLRNLAPEAWVIIAKFSTISIIWFLEKRIWLEKCLESKKQHKKCFQE